jgi:hypothetical protein
VDFESIFAAIDQAVSDAVSFLTGIINDLIKALDAVFKIIASIFQDILKFLKDFPEHLKDFLDDLWNEVIVPGWEKIQEIYDDIQTWLENFLDPILQIIQTIRDWFDKYIKPWITGIQDAISIIRAMLAALRILGVKWAAKLDADLQKIQGYLTDILQTVVGTLNRATTWLNFLSDPAGIIRRDVFHMNLFSSLPQLSRAVNFGKDRYLTASEAQNTNDDLGLKAGGAAIATQNADGSITYGPSVQRMNSNFDLEWNNYGNPKMPN